MIKLNIKNDLLFNKKLFLVDAMSLIYRAHFAFIKNPRINSQGINTGAILGFTNSLVEMIQKEAPTHIIVIFDSYGPTFRHQLFNHYKAHREAQPEDITVAIPYIKKLLQAFQIAVVEQEGYEADDIMGTLAQQAVKDSFEVYMMTTDKDLSQIVRDHIYLYKPPHAGQKNTTIQGPREVLSHWNIDHIHQVTDILGLQGDPTDNIPGIPFIGPKTAQKLIKQFTSIENLLANLHLLSGKLKENLMHYGEQGLISKKLATVYTDVPMHFSLDKSKYIHANKEQLRSLFRTLEFNMLEERLLRSNKIDTDSIASSKYTIHTKQHHYHLVNNLSEITNLVNKLQQQTEFAFYVTTTSLVIQEAILLGISFAYQMNEAYYVPMVYDDKQIAMTFLSYFQCLFSNTTIYKIGQNLKYDMHILQKYGIVIAPPLFDNMLAHALLMPHTRNNLQTISELYLNYTPIAIESLIDPKGKEQKNMKDIPINSMQIYAGESADMTLQLKKKLIVEIQKQQLYNLFFNIEMPLIQVLIDIEEEGVHIDLATLTMLSKKMTAERNALTKKIWSLADKEFNIDSAKQLGNILFNYLKIHDKPMKTKTGQYATGEEILLKLVDTHPIVSKILEYRELQKLQSTYVDALPTMISPIDGKIHTSYNQEIVVTGRLSSSNPNLQNIPIKKAKGREIRKTFISSSPNYVLLTADYSQIELRIMASYSKDITMITAFKEGKDIHTITASKLFKLPLNQINSDMRRQAKIANFGIIYGISAFGLAQRIPTLSKKEAANLINAYFEEFPGIKSYMETTIQQARKFGYVTTRMGRNIYLQNINSRNTPTRKFSERHAINAPIQGSAAELIKMAMIQIHSWLKTEQLQSSMIMQVHDELIFNVHHSEVQDLQTHVVSLMKNALPLDVPIEVEIGIGSNWYAAANG